jgi:hypothetical protein
LERGERRTFIGWLQGSAFGAAGRREPQLASGHVRATRILAFTAGALKMRPPEQIGWLVVDARTMFSTDLGPDAEIVNRTWPLINRHIGESFWSLGFERCLPTHQPFTQSVFQPVVQRTLVVPPTSIRTTSP